MQAWTSALRVVKTLEDAGYEAYLVGGAVRDYVLKRVVEDIDITTAATPQEIASLFPRAKEINKALGTMLVFEGEHHFEVTTFREEGTYLKHRRPETVTFTSDVHHDLTRRDFTMNAMLIDQHETLYDPLHGMDDLTHQRIRAIGTPEVRFEEDALRLLRAFRFVAKLGFDLEKTTAQAITKTAPLIQAIAIERIQDEWFKLLSAPHAKKALQAMLDTGFAKHFLQLESTIKTLLNLTFIPPIEEALALTYDEALWDCDPWRLSHKQLKAARRLKTLFTRRQQEGYPPTLLFEAGKKTIKQLERMREACGKHSEWHKASKAYDALPLKDARELALKGTHLKRYKALKEAAYQTVLNHALEAVLNGEVPNELEALITYLNLPGKES